MVCLVWYVRNHIQILICYYELCSFLITYVVMCTYVAFVTKSIVIFTIELHMFIYIYNGTVYVTNTVYTLLSLEHWTISA